MVYSNVAAGDPILASTINDLIKYGPNKPACRLIAAGAQTLTDNTSTALVFSGTDSIDTHGVHNPAGANTRMTPNIAGYYTFRGTFFMSSLVNGTTISLAVRKNGSSVLPPGGRLGGAAGHAVTTSGSPSTIGAAQAYSVSVIVMTDMNGTTDYVELMALQDSNGSDDTNASAQFISVFEMNFERVPD